MQAAAQRQQMSSFNLLCGYQIKRENSEKFSKSKKKNQTRGFGDFKTASFHMQHFTGEQGEETVCSSLQSV